MQPRNGQISTSPEIIHHAAGRPNLQDGGQPRPPKTMHPSVSVIIPALNEAINLPHVLPRIPPWVHEVILVDSHSNDGTPDVARQLMPHIRIIQQTVPGKGAALRAGFAAASGDIVVMLDGDGSNDPNEIGMFVRMLRNGADFVKGSRFIQGAGTSDMPGFRQWGNWCLTMLTNFLFKTRYSDITYGYNATWRCYAEALALEIDDWACEIINTIRAARNGLWVVELVSFESPRLAGEPKLRTFSAGWVILKAIVREAIQHRKTRSKNLLLHKHEPAKKLAPSLKEQ